MWHQGKQGKNGAKAFPRCVATYEQPMQCRNYYQDVVRAVIKQIGYDDPDVGFDANSCAVLTSIQRQSPDIVVVMITAPGCGAPLKRPSGPIARSPK